MKKKLYLCGPMTGIHDYNRTAFNDAESALRSAGFDVFNPTKNGMPADSPWEMHMRADISQMMACDGLAVLKGANFSKGAQIEIKLAMELKIQPIRALEYWLGD